MILIIDNYDSFSYNLFQLLGELVPDIQVVRNDQISLTEIMERSPSCLVLSPGPGHPKDAGICEDAIKNLSGKIPILGVCLGHQAICHAFGASIVRASKLMHGKQSLISIDTSSPIFQGLKNPFSAARYHSLAAEKSSLPSCLKVIAADPDGEIMAVSHRDYPVFGLQFHPESILTPEGRTILKNFLFIKEVIL